MAATPLRGQVSISNILQPSQSTPANRLLSNDAVKGVQTPIATNRYCIHVAVMRVTDALSLPTVIWFCNISSDNQENTSQHPYEHVGSPSAPRKRAGDASVFSVPAIKGLSALAVSTPVGASSRGATTGRLETPTARTGPNVPQVRAT